MNAEIHSQIVFDGQKRRNKGFHKQCKGSEQCEFLRPECKLKQFSRFYAVRSLRQYILQNVSKLAEQSKVQQQQQPIQLKAKISTTFQKNLIFF